MTAATVMWCVQAAHKSSQRAHDRARALAHARACLVLTVTHRRWTLLCAAMCCAVLHCGVLCTTGSSSFLLPFHAHHPATVAPRVPPGTIQDGAQNIVSRYLPSQRTNVPGNDAISGGACFIRLNNPARRQSQTSASPTAWVICATHQDHGMHHQDQGRPVPTA